MNIGQLKKGYYLANGGRVACWLRPECPIKGPLLFLSRKSAIKYARKVAGRGWKPKPVTDLSALLSKWGAGRYCWVEVTGVEVFLDLQSAWEKFSAEKGQS